MADVRRIRLSNQMNGWVSFIRSLDCDILTADYEEGVPYIYIGDVYKIRFNESTHSTYARLIIYENDLDAQEVHFGIGEMTVTVSCTSDFVWFTIYDPSDTSYSHRACCFFFEIIGNMHLYKWFWNYGRNMTYSFSALGTVTDKMTRYQYYHKAVLNFDAMPDRFLYASEIIIRDNGIKVVTDPNLLSCTTIDYDSVIVFNGHDYYSISPHTLIPMWSTTD